VSDTTATRRSATGRTSRPGGMRPAIPLARVFLVATGLAVVTLSQMYLAESARRTSVSIGNVASTHLTFWIVWAVRAPAVFSWASRLRGARLRTVPALLLHGGTAVVLGLADAAVVFAIRSAAGYAGSGAWRPSAYVGFASWQLTSNVLAYGLLVGVYYASLFQTRVRERELAAARLRAELGVARRALTRPLPKPRSRATRPRAAVPYLERIAVRVARRVVVLPVSRIDRIEAADNYVRLHADGATYLLCETITRMARTLDPARFAPSSRRSTPWYLCHAIEPL